MSDKEPNHHDLHIMLVKMDGKMDGVVQRLDTAIDDAEDYRNRTDVRLDRHAKRLNGLTSWRNTLAGAWAALTLAGGAVVTWIKGGTGA